MGSKIKIINTSGKRFPKKAGINQTNLTSDGVNLSMQSPVFNGNVGGEGNGGNFSLPIPNKLNNNTSEPLILSLRGIGDGDFNDNTTVTVLNSCSFNSTNISNINLSNLSSVGFDIIKN